ncbi:MAG: amidohydrolase [Planctomycetota bacterium]
MLRRMFRKNLLLTLLAIILSVAPTTAQEPAEGASHSWEAAELERLQELYRHLHANPELSFHEVETAKTMAAQLVEAGFKVTSQVGGTGVVGVMKNGEGPTVLVRADMDALPVPERTGLPYASKVTTTDDDGVEVPVMHACGHDMHMTVWAGTAAYLASHREHWSGTLVFLAQPAEERGAGAKAMLDDGLLERFPKPDFCLALHVDGKLAVGTIGSCPGYALGNVDSVDITVPGKGGHGSTPHVTHDPIVLASRIVMGLQTIVSREVPPVEDAVVTVGSFHGGAKHNIIPDVAELKITVRSYKPEIRRLVLDAIKRTALGEAKAAGFPDDLMPIVEVSEREFTPATYNDPDFVARIDARFKKVLGEDAVIPVPAIMGGEDFGRYGPAAGCPSYIFWLGVAPKAQWQAAQDGGAPLAGTHNSAFAPEPEGSIRTGVTAMTEAVLELLPKR